MPKPTNKRSERYQLTQFKSLFEKLTASSEGFVLIGGQAVNYWAERYLSQERELAKLSPFTSADIDFLGTREDVAKLGKLVGREPLYPSWHALTMLAGVIPCKLEAGETEIEVVRSVPRSTADEVRATSLVVMHEGLRLHVINPIVLLRSKAGLARTIAQEGRQDVYHLRVMLLCVRGFLRELLYSVTSGEITARDWLNIVKDLLTFTESDLGRNVAKQYGIEWVKVLPELDLSQVTSQTIRTFYEKRVPLWRERLKRVTN